MPVRDFTEAKRESRLCHWDFCEAKRETVPPRDFTQAKCESFRPQRAPEKSASLLRAEVLSRRARFVESELILPGKFVLFIGLLFSPRRVMNVSRPENGPPPRAGKAAGQGRHTHQVFLPALYSHENQRRPNAQPALGCTGKMGHVQVL